MKEIAEGYMLVPETTGGLFTQLICVMQEVSNSKLPLEMSEYVWESNITGNTISTCGSACCLLGYASIDSLTIDVNEAVLTCVNTLGNLYRENFIETLQDGGCFFARTLCLTTFGGSRFIRLEALKLLGGEIDDTLFYKIKNHLFNSKKGETPENAVSYLKLMREHYANERILW